MTPLRSQILISILCLVLVCHGLPTWSQTQTKTGTSVDETSYAEGQLNYISDAVFLGRKDTATAPYLYATMGYHHKSGVYGEGSVSYLTKSNESRIDLFLLSAGYEKTFGSLSTDFSVTKYFFNEESYNVISSVDAAITAQLRYEMELLNLAWAGSVYFSGNNSTDIMMLAQLSHDFTTSNNRWQISPILEFQFGSQKFYEQYFIEQKLKKGTNANGSSSGNGSGTGGSDDTSTITTVQLSESESFNLMAVEVNLAIWYQSPPFTASLIPSYVIPTNESEISVGDSLVKENLESTFYLMAGIAYRF